MNDNPISPKLWAVIAALASPGVVLLIVGALIDNQTLITVGAALLGASPVAGAAGYAKDDPNRVVGRRRRARREAGQVGAGLVVFVLFVILLVLVLKAATGSWFVLLLLLLVLLAFFF